MTPQIQNPTVTLYAFHLRDDFDQGLEQVAKDADKIWKQISALGKADIFNIQELRELNKKLVCYQNGKYDDRAEKSHENRSLTSIAHDSKTLNFQQVSQPGQPTLRVQLEPFCIEDTYAVDLTVGYEKKTDVTVFAQLNPKYCLLPKNIQSSLGQTVLLYAEIVCVLQDDLVSIADACVREFVGQAVDYNRKRIAQGKIFGSPIFEYDSEEISPANRVHIFVLLNCHPNTLKLLAADGNYWLINLLYHRSKIIFNYHKSREWYEHGQSLVSKLEEEGRNLVKPETDIQPENRLQELKKVLHNSGEILWLYSRCLRNLNEYQNSIVIHADNYSKCLDKIRQLSLPDDDIAFLQNFLEVSHNKYQKQIQVDLNYLTPSKDLFQQMIDTTRGMVEIQQAEIDKYLQNTIAIASAGLAGGAIVASNSGLLTAGSDSGQITVQLWPPRPLNPHPFTVAVFISILAAVVAAWIVNLALKKLLEQ